MYDTAGEQPKWEWVEVKNTTGADIDLANWVLDDDDDNNLLGARCSAEHGSTNLPAHGVGVLYNSSPSNGLNSDPSRFTNTWGSVSTLIGVNPVTALASPDAIGLWQNTDDYEADDLMVVSGIRRTFNTAISSVNFQAGSGYPSATNGKSLAWKGTGSVTDPAQWVASAVGDPYGAHANTMTEISGAPLNSITDVGTPGTPPSAGGGALGGLLISEIMYDPRSANPAESAWEWVEVYNNTGSLIDFGNALNPYYQAVFDDDDDAHKSDANLTTGSIPQGGTAVLFNAATNTLENMQAAWGGLVNFIPVSTWTDLGNSGDLVAIWPNLAAYNADALPGTASPRRGTAFAATSVLYDDDDVTAMWPNNDGDSSITLTGLDVDQHTDTSWALSTSGSPNQVYATLTDHPGGDVGSPGFVPSGVVVLSGDFNGDHIVNAADYTTWRNNKGATEGALLGGNGNGGVVDDTDYALWKAHYGESSAGSGGLAGAVPEPTGLLLFEFGLVGLAMGGRKSDR